MSTSVLIVAGIAAVVWGLARHTTGLVVAALCLAYTAVLLTQMPRWAWQWLTVRRMCAWCKRRLGGNPWAPRTTHGICRACLTEQQRIRV